MNQVVRSSFLTAIVALVATGCSRSSQCPEIYDTVSASGILTYKQQPLANYCVTFFQEGKRPAQGLTDAQGRFTLGTNERGDGAPLGVHKVTVAFAAESPVDVASATAEEIVKATPRPKVKIPTKYISRDKTDLVVEIPRTGSTELKVNLN